MPSPAHGTEPGAHGANLIAPQHSWNHVLLEPLSPDTLGSGHLPRYPEITEGKCWLQDAHAENTCLTFLRFSSCGGEGLLPVDGPHGRIAGHPEQKQPRPSSVMATTAAAHLPPHAWSPGQPRHCRRPSGFRVVAQAALLVNRQVLNSGLIPRSSTQHLKFTAGSPPRSLCTRPYLWPHTRDARCPRPPHPREAGPGHRMGRRMGRRSPKEA